MDPVSNPVNMNPSSEDACQLHTASAAEGDIISPARAPASLVENGGLHLVDSWTWSNDANTTIDVLEDVVTHGLLDPTPTIDDYFPRHSSSVQGHSLPLIAAPSTASIASSLEVEAGGTQTWPTETDPHMSTLSEPAWGPEEILCGVGQWCSINEMEILCNQMYEAHHEREVESQFRMWLEHSAERRCGSDNDDVCGSGKR